MEKKKFEYKTKYQKEKLKRIYIDIPKELGEQFDTKLKGKNLTRADILLPEIKKFLKNK